MGRPDWGLGQQTASSNTVAFEVDRRHEWSQRVNSRYEQVQSEHLKVVMLMTSSNFQLDRPRVAQVRTQA
jgi:hypothetical protein